MRRREFIAGLGGAAAAWPLVVHAQQPTREIGYVGFGSPGDRPELVSAFQEGLKSAGYVDGQNVVIEYRWAQERSDRLPALFSELIARNVAVIFTSGNVALRVARAATTTIPVVFYIATDPVAMGYVASINRPGGNLTGVSLFNISLGAKQVELLHQLVPANSVIAVLSNPENPSADLHLRDLEEAAQKLGHKIYVTRAMKVDEFADIFADVAQHRIASIVVDDDALFNGQRARLADLAARHKIAAIHSNREAVEAGGLMSYGGDIVDAFRQCGIYIGRILDDEKPTDLPVQQSTKIELVVNLKTAKALGLTIPETLLATADEVIQ
jgi:putative tryptophan/tyrosine transport system substrate-binding protein